MGGLLTFFGATAAAPAMALRIKALLICALAMIAVCLALTTWALLERTWRLSCEKDNVRLEAEVAVLSDSLDRQNKGIDASEAAGKAAQAGVDKLLEAAGKVAAASAGLVAHARDVIGKPPGKRADGKDKDCVDAWSEIEGRAKP